MRHIICTVTNDLNYDQRMIRICSTLVQAGYKVTLIGRRRSDSRALKRQPFEQVRMNLFFKKGKLFYLEYNIRLFFYLLFHSFDLVNSVDLDSILPGLLAAKLKGKKVSYDAHEYFTEVPEVVERPLVQGIWKRVEAFAVPRIDFAYTVCQSIANEFSSKYNKAFEVVRNVPFKKAVKANFKLPR
ncbi:MAG: glycosyltransferase, partial [Saprospiraceae bacterium]|nr:glycosyltransferase [Saprospiraceae bacterium]